MKLEPVEPSCSREFTHKKQKTQNLGQTGLKRIIKHLSLREREEILSILMAKKRKIIEVSDK